MITPIAYTDWVNLSQDQQWAYVRSLHDQLRNAERVASQERQYRRTQADNYERELATLRAQDRGEAR